MNRAMNYCRPITLAEADPFVVGRGWEEITMRVVTGVWKAVTHLVAVGASFLLVLTATTALPSALGSAVLLGMMVAVGLVAGGVLERPGVRLARRASAPSEDELQILSALPNLGEPHRIFVCRSTAGTAAPVAITGRFTVVSAAFVEAVHRGWVSAPEATALVVHARGRHRDMVVSPRGEIVLAVLESPGRMLFQVFRGVGWAFSWLPLGSLAWRLRGVVGVMCLAQSVGEGHVWPGVLGAGMITLTYLVPAADRAIEARATTAGDAAVMAAGLGGVLVEVLARSGHRLPLARRQRLQATPTPGTSSAARPASAAPRRHLHLVRS